MVPWNYHCGSTLFVGRKKNKETIDAWERVEAKAAWRCQNWRRALKGLMGRFLKRHARCRLWNTCEFLYHHDWPRLEPLVKSNYFGIALLWLYLESKMVKRSVIIWPRSLKLFEKFRVKFASGFSPLEVAIFLYTGLDYRVNINKVSGEHSWFYFTQTLQKACCVLWKQKKAKLGLSWDNKLAPSKTHKL